LLDYAFILAFLIANSQNKPHEKFLKGNILKGIKKDREHLSPGRWLATLI